MEATLRLSIAFDLQLRFALGKTGHTGILWRKSHQCVYSICNLQAGHLHAMQYDRKECGDMISKSGRTKDTGALQVGEGFMEIMNRAAGHGMLGPDWIS